MSGRKKLGRPRKTGNLPKAPRRDMPLVLERDAKDLARQVHAAWTAVALRSELEVRDGDFDRLPVERREFLVSVCQELIENQPDIKTFRDRLHRSDVFRMKLLASVDSSFRTRGSGWMIINSMRVDLISGRRGVGRTCTMIRRLINDLAEDALKMSKPQARRSTAKESEK